MRYLFAILLILLPITAVAGQLEVTSLPWTIDQDDHSVDTWDTVTIAGTMLSSATSGVSFQALYQNEAHHWYFNLGTDTIYFGTGNGDNNIGIRIYGTSIHYPNNIKIVGGYVLHNPSDTTVDENLCFSIRGDSITVDGTVAEIKGYNGIVYEGAGGYFFNNKIGGIFRSFVSAFDNRCNFDAPVVKINHLLDSSLTNNSADYHVDIDGLTIDGGPHVGILIYGESGDIATPKIHACSVMTDMRNEFYLEYSGTCYSAANAYGISVTLVGPGTLIYDNVVTSGTEFAGNRGIYIGQGEGSEANPILVYDNYVDVNEGPGVEMGDANPAHGLRIRYGPEYIDVYDNTFICTGDSIPATTDYGIGVHPVRLSTGSATTHVTIHNNQIEAISLSSSGVACNGVTFDGIDYADTYFLESNNIISSGTIYKYGEIGTQDLGPTGVSIIGDTVQFADTTINPITFYLGHLGNNWDCTENTARDIVYVGATADNDITFSSDVDEERDITIQRTLDLYVQGNNDLPVEAAICSTWNNYDVLLWVDTTTSGGQYGSVVSYRYEAALGSDSTAFNDFVLHAWFSGDFTYDSSFTVGSSAAGATDTLTLGSTEGTGEWGGNGGGGKQYQTVKYLGGRR